MIRLPIRVFCLMVVFTVVGFDSLLAADELPSAADLLGAYVESNGGHANIQSLTSLAVSGVVVDDEANRYDFKLYRKRPNKMRMQLELENYSLMTVSDGDRVYQQVFVQGVPRSVQELEGALAAQTIADSSLDGPFYQLRTRPDWLRVVAEVEVEGEPSYEIEVSEAANSTYQRIWISSEHQQEIKLSRLVLNQEGEEVSEEIYFSDFDQIRGVWLAHCMRYFRDGELTQTVQIEKVSVNVGLFDSYFSKPSSQ
ncbi:hypothetical protein QEH59_02755 [Coraliomargarita sp. SDUM461004]|uniref:Outer membrane lipoprotein-sorting protein n=1 Tax=Thalassobacterium sedimentorum TaxID=3041258 RepID=A0ABU1AI70_9BACT|nr:hypothetical protein [Coraliomargarita sp. SDUM461004]MDQ8193328.1 hypothetical protein [Coraliomargarita sp. SDUM461004]